jgi:uncharacterized membrane protein (UPF0127 family)
MKGIRTGYKPVQERFLRPLLRDPQTLWLLRNARSRRVLADQLSTAFDSTTRRSGLLGRQTFEDGEAMIIAPTNAIHTFFMRFPIDIAFVTRSGRVAKTCHGVRPWRLAAALYAHAAIELPAGTLARSETVRGDVLELVRAADL